MAIYRNPVSKANRVVVVVVEPRFVLKRNKDIKKTDPKWDKRGDSLRQDISQLSFQFMKRPKECSASKT